jgi:hypothetical protein
MIYHLSGLHTNPKIVFETPPTSFSLFITVLPFPSSDRPTTDPSTILHSCLLPPSLPSSPLARPGRLLNAVRTVNLLGPAGRPRVARRYEDEIRDTFLEKVFRREQTNICSQQNMYHLALSLLFQRQHFFFFFILPSSATTYYH